MPFPLRSLPMLCGLAFLSACGGNTEKNEMAALDAKLANAADAPVNIADMDRGADEGGIEHAPAPTVVKGGDQRPMTLGGLAEQQAKGGAKSGCGRAVTYGPEWAARLPKPFALYPGAKLVEAAGVSNGRCDLAIANFTTDAPINDVIDHYYTQAKRAGYDAEHQLCKGEHRLGGTQGQDGPAYMIFARKAADGRTDVDIVANAAQAR